MLQDRNGHIWLGAGDYGLFKFIPEVDSFANFNPREIHDQPPVVHVMSMFEDKVGRFWIGTGHGIFLFDRESKIFTHVETVPGAPDVWKKVGRIVEDRFGNTWFGTDWGVFRYDPENNAWKHFSTDNPSKPNDFFWGMVGGLTEVHAGNSDKMWISTGSGLWVYNFGSGKMQQFKSLKGDPVTGGAKYLYYDDNNLL